MALIVEDGTGKADADSYCSLAAASARHTALGNAAWAALANDAAREVALRQATQYMLQTYRSRWAGSRVSSTQALDWPRYDVWVDGFPILSDIVPPEVVNACADLALKASAGELAPDVAAPVTEKTVGPITVKYVQGARQTVQYRAVDGLLAPFLTGGGNAIKVVRA